MSIGFDTLTFAKRLTEAGERPAVAEAHAMALRDFVMDAIATKTDIEGLRIAMKTDIDAVKTDLRAEMKAMKTDLQTEIQAVKSGLQAEIQAVRADLQAEGRLLRKDIDAMGLKLTVRMGGMLAVAVGAAATLNKIL